MAAAAARRVPNVAIATCADRPGLYPEGVLLIEALHALGVIAVPVIWNAGTGWDDFDAVMIRTTEDYFRSPATFLGWAQAGAPPAQLARHGRVEPRQALPGRAG